MKNVITSRRLIIFTAVCGLLSTLLFAVFVLQSDEPVVEAVGAMSLGLIIFWIVIGGVLQVRFRDHVRAFVQRLPGDWRLKFVLFCILMAMLEEAVTVTMTNLAPAFGVGYGDAYITASGNYLDVILFHSVVVFVPMFVAWAWLLSRYQFSPNAVFLLFGLTGTLAESLSFGTQNLIRFGMWVFVYGLMVYLPAYSIPTDRSAHPPRWWHHPLTIVFALVSAIVFILIVWGLGGLLGVQSHPAIHFPPLSTE
jgi:hypothetical protein